MTITISDSAATRIFSLLQADGRKDAFFRVEVKGGGCQGFEYQYGISAEQGDEDEVFVKDGATVHVDRTSLLHLRGTQINWLSTLAEEKFEFRNPNAISSCGCGVSFSI